MNYTSEGEEIVEPIEKPKECEHISVNTTVCSSNAGNTTTHYRCTSCHKWLTPTWTEER